MSTIDKIISLLSTQNKKQKELTDYLGISKNSFTDWKSGRIKSYTKYIPQIAEYLGVSTDYLLGKTDVRNAETEKMTTYSYNGEEGTAEQGFNAEQLNDINKLMKAAKQLSPEKLAALIQVAENMK